MRYDTRHGVLTLFSLETYNLYSIASQLKCLFDPVTIGISLAGSYPRSLYYTRINYTVKIAKNITMTNNYETNNFINAMTIFS